MPYYSDLGLSGIPSSSVYSSLFLPGPYSNHSSIIASNFSHSKPLPRHFRGGYKPHLSTISELRRINSPNLYHTSPKVNLHPIKRINTADIDVSVNKYKKYEKYEKPKTEHVEKKTPEQTPSPKRSPRASLEDKEPSREARPNPNIRRDRATVRLHTVHNDTLQREIGAVRSWRDNFKPEELDGKFEDTSSAPKKMRKTPGQILKEKFLIRSRSKENMLKPESKRLSRKRSVRKSPSFHDICEAITSDNIDEDLNPGQPTEVQRRQTRQLSGDRILKEIRRTSTNLSEDDLQILDAILAEQNDSKNESETAIDDEGVFESRGSVRKKKAIRKKSNDNLTLEDRPSTVRKSHSREKLDENEAKLALKRRSTKKRLRPSTNLSRDSLTEKMYKNVIRDISQVEIERTAFKPKPVITGSGDIEETKPSLKAVVDEIQVKEAPTPKKEKKFRFNVIVEVDEEVSTNKSTASPTKKVLKIPAEKFSFSNDNKGTVQLPKARSPIITSILKKRPLSHNGQVIQQKEKSAKTEQLLNGTSLNMKLNLVGGGEENNLTEVKTETKDNGEDIANKDVLESNKKTEQKDDSKLSGANQGSSSFSNLRESSSNLSDSQKISTTVNGKHWLDEISSRPSSPLLRIQEGGKKFDSPPLSPVTKKQNIFNKGITPPTSPVPWRVSAVKRDTSKKDNLPSPNLSHSLSSDEKQDNTKQDISQEKNWLDEISRPSSPLKKIEETGAKIDTPPTFPITEEQNGGSFDFGKGITPPLSPVPWRCNMLNREVLKTDETSSVNSASEKKFINSTSTHKGEQQLDNAKSPPSSPIAKVQENRHKISVAAKEKHWLHEDSSRPSSPLTKIQEIGKIDTPPASPVSKKTNIFNTGVTPPTSPLPWKNSALMKTSKNDEISSPDLVNEKTLSNSTPSNGNQQIYNAKSPPTSPTTKVEESPKIADTPTKEKHWLDEISRPSSPLTKLQIGKSTETPPSSPVTKKQFTFNKGNATPPSSNSKKDNLFTKQFSKNDAPIVNSDASKKDETVSTPPAVKNENLFNKKVSESASDILKGMRENNLPPTKDENDNTINSCDSKQAGPESAEQTEAQKKLMSKRSLVEKANVDDPDLEVFVPPEPEPEPDPEPEPQKDVFVPLQSNRLSQFMHPWKKPQQFDVCPVELFARPKVIRGRHYPRPRGNAAAQPPPEESSEDSSEEETEDETEDEDTSSEEETSEEEEFEEGGAVKIGASTSSNDSGFGSGALSRNKDCDVNIHKKCEKLTANLCGVNQKLVVEAIESVRKGSVESRDSPTSNHANNPAFALDAGDVPEQLSQSSTFTGFQRSGRITPPATTIPRFRKYCVDDFNFLKVLGKGSFGKVLLAELKGTEYYYAVKCLKKDVVLEDDDVECTLIERKVLALGTRHPYLCHLLCTFQTESHLFFVMEYLNGGDLMFHIQASGRFPEHQARFYGAEIVSGLKFLHNKGIVYRDLKLDNVLLDFDGHVRIADFGMCKLQIFLDRMAETFCGTPDYMAPEIIKGQHYNQAVDWWSFGVLLYEMLLGQSPFSGCDEDELFWSICNEKPVLPRFLSAEATNILMLFLEKDASKRLGTRFSPHGDIQDQPFFKPIDWCALEARQLEAPFKPQLQHPLDTQYFDKHFTVEKAKLTPIDTTILQSMDQTQFQGFSYTNPNATNK